METLPAEYIGLSGALPHSAVLQLRIFGHYGYLIVNLSPWNGTLEGICESIDPCQTQLPVAQHADERVEIDVASVYRIFLEFYQEHGLIASDDDVVTMTRLLGRPPRSHEAFARETAKEWQR